ncbi:hypothetical protein DUNSADRAFT_1252 [Dunaliella salina]|uniref:Encoded protein n=1 Tax=Dunaliella salina TaxID=3046 RepID=A0ABQ7FXQ3_DUNSA|nr:hypothetical protein DUNSADRAFT_1252 [Dunaliella salina]|eukprot:KAF5827135.1 hypothetical protein DUNSADRAFT_1252 [Dunaliella salina]
MGLWECAYVMRMCWPSVSCLAGAGSARKPGKQRDSLRPPMQVVCRKEVNGDIGRAFKALKQANKMVGELWMTARLVIIRGY